MAIGGWTRSVILLVVCLFGFSSWKGKWQYRLVHCSPLKFSYHTIFFSFFFSSFSHIFSLSTYYPGSWLHWGFPGRPRVNISYHTSNFIFLKHLNNEKKKKKKPSVKNMSRGTNGYLTYVLFFQHLPLCFLCSHFIHPFIHKIEHLEFFILNSSKLVSLIVLKELKFSR